MIEQIYEESLKDKAAEIERLTFPEVIRFCRELMGLKQSACSEFLGMKYPRYKKIELGAFSEPLESWEIVRLQKFFKLPDGFLKKGQKTFLNKGISERMELGNDAWDASEETRGKRNIRSEGDYKRVAGPID